MFDVYDLDKISRADFSDGNFINDNDNSLQRDGKKKNYRLFYQLYYYSILLNNENNLPYPKFFIYHDWIRQHFGCFRMAVTNKDVNNFEKKKKNRKNEDKEIIYKSDVINNNFDNEFSYKMISISKNVVD